MIEVSSDLRALMTSGQYQRADLYTISLVNGDVLYWTSWQVAIVSGGNTFLPVMRIGGDRKWRVTRGLEASTFSVTVGVDQDHEMMINGVPFRQAARAGLLSGAQLQMDWAYLSGGVLVGILTRFLGTVGQVMPDRLGAKLTVNSPLKVLDLSVPTKIYGPRCPWTLGDADCGINLPSFAVAGTVTAGADRNTIPCTVGNPAGYFNLGVVTFTSGLCTGLKRSIRSYTPGSLVLATPLPFAPASGDALSATPGCDHTVPSLSVAAVIPAYASIQEQVSDGMGHQVGTVVVTPTHITVAQGEAGFADLGVTYASGPKAGQSFKRITTGTIGIGQYTLVGNQYTFAGTEAGTHITINFKTTATNTTATCRTIFNNASRNGATPYIPPPETAY